MPMSSGGYAASSSGCATRPKVREIGSTGYAGPTQHSSPIGRYVMATAEHREPCDSRGSCTVLGAPGGEIPPGDSTSSERSNALVRVRLAMECGCWLTTAAASHAVFGRAIPCSAVAQQRHKIIRNRVALVGEESVSGLTGGTVAGSIRRPTHAYLHHRQ